MEWLADPTIWLGLLTLIILEIVLGIDNLIFIAILADKLPPQQRDKARVIGLTLALVMRLGLLASISWLVTLTAPLLTVLGKTLSGRDLILLIGGLFLLFKATMELHERLEGPHQEHSGPRIYAGFWSVVAQIVVLDAVFSLDAVITAVGMVDELAVMMVAVIIAIMLMIVASKPLTTFVNAHPTVVILCLGFLLMIGFALVAEGLGFHIPKGYLYAAIGFSVLIEVFNQVARANRQRALASKRPMRERTAEAVLRLLGGRPEFATAPEFATVDDQIADLVGPSNERPLFEQTERTMIRRVLHLAERPIKTIMTPRRDVHRIDVIDNPEAITTVLRQSPYSRIVISQDGADDEPLGIVQKKDLLQRLIDGQPLDPLAVLSQPLYLPDAVSVLSALEQFKNEATQIAFVVNEFGSFEGLVTLTDIMEEIAGSFPEDYNSTEPDVVRQEDGSYLVKGRTDLEDLREQVGLVVPNNADFHTVAGLVLDVFQQIPTEGDSVEIQGWRIEVIGVDGHRIDKLRISRLPDAELNPIMT